MKNILILLILFQYSISCKQKENFVEHQELNEFVVGKISFQLPKSYKLVFPDTINYPGLGYIKKDDCFKLRITSGGFGPYDENSLKAPNKNFTVKTDTTENHLKIVGYHNGDKNILWATVMKLKEQKNNLFENYNYEYLFNASTEDYGVHICLNTDEKILFARSFKNIEIK